MGAPGPGRTVRAALPWIALGALLLLLPAGGSAKERVAVLDFKNYTDMDRPDLEYLTDDVVRAEVRRLLPRDQYFVVTKESLRTYLEDQGVDLGEACEGSCAVDIGRKIQVHLILTGSVRKIRKDLLVTLKMYNTKSGEFLGSEEARGRDVAELAPEMRSAVGRLLYAVAEPEQAGAPAFLPSGPAPRRESAPAFEPSGPAPRREGAGRVTEVKPTTPARAGSGAAAGLYITSEPPGAVVLLDGVRAGVTSPAFQKTDLRPGVRTRVTLRKKDYHDTVFDVDLAPGVARYDGVPLAPAFGSLEITSVPPGATVKVGGRQVGVTPHVEKKLASGKTLVTLEKQGYLPVSNQVLEIRDGQVTRENFVLESLFGTLSVDSSPRGAAVIVSGKKEGRTPLTLSLAPGEYRVELDMDGHTRRTFDVTVARGQTTRIEPDQGRLERRFFSISVFTEPVLPGATIYLDGRSTGQRAPATLTEVPEGRHRVSARTDILGGEAEVSGQHGDAVTVKIPVRDIEPEPGSVWREPFTGMEFVRVPAGCYTMGCGSWTDSCDEDERPARKVCLKGFWIGKTEVTQKQWTALMGNNPSRFSGKILNHDDWPVEQVSWNDAQAFVRKLQERTGEEYEFRLPTEAEWEYACRSGGKDQRYSGGNSLDGLGWYGGNSGGKAHVTANKVRNGLGIFDMSGNVSEWCEDVYRESAYRTLSHDNPVATVGGQERVQRGGSWFGFPKHLRCADRNRGGPDNRQDVLGFRVVRTR